MSSTSKPKQNLINHMAFVIDRSGSMGHLANSVVKLFDTQIKELAKTSQEVDQETRASVYLFDTSVDCLFYDKDVMRLPSMNGLYRADGGTSLIDGTMQAINELKQTAQLHGDHAFLLYVLTDGGENSSRNYKAEQLTKELKNLPDNWTVAVFVPDISGVAAAKRYGFEADNIQQWEASEKGITEVAQTFRAATQSYYTARASGQRSCRSLFKTVDTSTLASRKVSDNLTSLTNDKFMLLAVDKDSTIRDFVENKAHIAYKAGSTYYQLTKTEEVQDYKQVAVQNKISGKVYVGTEARDLLGLPKQTVKLKPETTASKFNIFIQSTSVNRKLLAGTTALVLT